MCSQLSTWHSAWQIADAQQMFAKWVYKWMTISSCHLVANILKLRGSRSLKFISQIRKLWAQKDVKAISSKQTKKSDFSDFTDNAFSIGTNTSTIQNLLNKEICYTSIHKSLYLRTEKCYKKAFEFPLKTFLAVSERIQWDSGMLL